jgi:hypothetical protein
MNDEIAKTTRKNRLTLLLLLAIFLAPALGSWLLYANLDKLHLSTTNKGEFVQPPRQIDVTGLALPAGYFAHHHTLIYVGGPDCAADCRHALQVMQGTQLALGESTGLAHRLYLAASPDAVAAVQGDAGLTTLDATGKPALEAFDADANQYIYLADPNGYVVLRYKLSDDPKRILIDLRHLLGLSEG